MKRLREAPAARPNLRDSLGAGAGKNGARSVKLPVPACEIPRGRTAEVPA